MARCTACGASVSVENVFPGGSVQCTCGAKVTAPSGASAPAGGTSAHEAAVASPPTAHAAHCPRCPADLVVRDEDGVVVAACPSHHGLFVTHRALVALVDTAAMGPPALDAPAVPCPRCAEPMTARTFGRDASIVVDVCEQHGTWFDAGELRAAAKSVNEQRSVSVTPARVGDAPTKQAAATLDVALALEEARDEETAREAIDLADDLVDTFNVFVLGRTRTTYGRRYR
jgi:Zn-finger nucleic acid-binding protein